MRYIHTLGAAAIASVMLVGTVNAAPLNFSMARNLEIESGQLSFDAGLMVGELGMAELDTKLFGGRAAYCPVDNVLVFGDAGLLMFDEDIVGEDSSFAFGGGGIYIFDVDLPFILGGYGSYHRTSLEGSETDTYGSGYYTETVSVKATVTLTDLSFGAVASGETSIDGLSWFGQLGVHLLKAEIEAKASAGGYSETETDDDDETEIGFGCGANYQINDALSLFGGIDIVDEMFIGGGVRCLLPM